jgi:diadenosine tetraphosphatase ApaH/serine/threonine PP2A family protein phosphatase
VGPQILARLAPDLVGMGNDLVERAILADERGGLLGADARHARDVVRGVPLEAIEVRHERGGDAVVEVLHARWVHDRDLADALLGGDHAHVLGGELVDVAVAGEEQHVVAGLLAPEREGAQDVVALPALELADGHVKHAQELLDHGELLVQVRVHRRALCLVAGHHLHAHERLALVEGADDAVGPEAVHHLDEHVEEPEQGVGRPSVRRAHGLANRVERAVHEGVPVYDGYGAAPVGVRGVWHASPLGCCSPDCSG